MKIPYHHGDTAETCPLCAAVDSYRVACDGGPYYRCRSCDMVFLHRGCLLPAVREKAEYDLHRNEVHDAGYRRFLSRTFAQVQSHCMPPARGLDFGCGPGPALVMMAREAGYRMDAFDPFYANQTTVFGREYDFITATEVAEHLAHPRFELERLWSLLRPGGILVIQTQRVLDDVRFRDWRYRRDPTHVSFFAERSFCWLAAHFGAGLTLPHKDVAVLHKPA